MSWGSDPGIFAISVLLKIGSGSVYQIRAGIYIAHFAHYPPPPLLAFQIQFFPEWPFISKNKENTQRILTHFVPSHLSVQTYHNDLSNTCIYIMKFLVSGQGWNGRKWVLRFLLHNICDHGQLFSKYICLNSVYNKNQISVSNTYNIPMVIISNTSVRVSGHKLPVELEKVFNGPGDGTVQPPPRSNLTAHVNQPIAFLLKRRNLSH